MVLLEEHHLIISRGLLYEEKKWDKTKEVWRVLWNSSHLHRGVIKFKNYSLTYLGNTCACPLAETYMRGSITLSWLYCQNEPAATYDAHFTFLYRANFVLFLLSSLCAHLATQLLPWLDIYCTHMKVDPTKSNDHTPQKTFLISVTMT